MGFGPEPKPEEVEDTCEGLLTAFNTTLVDLLCLSPQHQWFFIDGMIGEEFWMTAAGAGGDEGELVDDDL